MKPIRFLSFEENKVLLCDMAGRSGPDVASLFSDLSEVIREQPPDSVLVLIDASSADQVHRLVLDRRLASMLRTLVKGNRRYVRARAIVFGDSDKSRIIAEFLARFTDQPVAFFTNRDDAVAWLVAQ